MMKTFRHSVLFVAAAVLACLPAARVLGAGPAGPAVLDASLLQGYVEAFNLHDEELYSNAIPNAKALEFLRGNIPLLDCPDEDIRRTYYFRWWTYRKHLKQTPDGWVVTEFLPQVPWSGKHNTINCPAGHHFYEGRWLHDPKYLNDYAVFWFRKGGGVRAYSFWAADAIYAMYLVHMDKALSVDLLDDLVKNYHGWEQSRLLQDGLFWQIDDRDGMEVSVGKSGKRATINSYMYGDARAIARIAELAGRQDVAREYDARADRLRALVEQKLWDPQAKFFKTQPRSEYELTRPQSSSDGSVPRYHWNDKDHRGTPEWLQYDFSRPVNVESAEVYWHADGGLIALPKSWRLLYQQGGRWRPVENAGAFGVERDAFNKVIFKPVQTSAIRMEVQSQPGRAAGLYEWRVLSGGRNVAPSAKISCSFHLETPRGDMLKTLNDGESLGKEAALVDVRELHGYTPWYFNLPEPGKGYEVAWKQLMDPNGFCAPFGPATAEQRHPGFKLSYEGHACQWNGPSWPLSTAVTLTAMANVLNNYPQDAINKADYLKMLRVYAHSQQRKLDDGTVVPWIDENINPLTGDWIARTMLLAEEKRRKEQGKPAGIRERGKDYNHSSFCDLVITGLVGLRPRGDGVVEVNPLVPEGAWDFFCLDNVLYHGKVLTIIWDSTGAKYGRGAGLRVLANGKEIAHGATLGKLTGRL